jgi:carbon storage regulator
MLVLTRKRGESIIIGDSVEIKVLELHGSQVKLGVQAPHVITVHRKEVYDAIQSENRAAATAPPASAEDIARLFRRDPKETN